MKHTFLFSVVFLCLLISGCSTKNINSNQTFQQTCNANPVNNNENQEKQCCLKDSLETRIKHIEEICILKEYKLSKDSVCITSSSSSYIAASSSFTAIPTRNTKIHGQLDYKSKDVVDMRHGCFGANCQVNNIVIENTEERNNSDCSTAEKLLKIVLNEYIESTLFTITISLLGGIFLLIPAIIRKDFYIIKNFLKKIKKQPFLSLKKWFYNSLLPSFIKKFFAIIKKIYSFIKEKIHYCKSYFIYEKKTYNILSPTDDAEISQETLNQLKFAILDTDEPIRNIAITGLYGSGKSSAWLTFCKKYKVSKLKKLVKISLSKFCDNEEENSSSKVKLAKIKEEETKIEIAIVQQLIYSKKNEDLKYSNYPKIKNLTDLKTIFPTSFLFILCTLILPFANNSVYCVINYLINMEFPQGIILLTLTFSFIYICLFYAIQKINTFSISKICLKEFEITLGKSESVFAKYLNEIVYFFEATKCDCVVIEDLDRFNSIEIFTKLREINELINNYPAIKKTVKFVYLIKDDILPKYKRTKFFDFIVPIVPILNGDNAINYTKLHFLRNNIDDYNNEKPYLSDEYLDEIDEYLKDLRLIKNCFNEFKIFKNEIQLNLSNHGEEELFSLILYKNLYPADFQQLLKQEGVLFYCLNKACDDLCKKYKNIKRNSLKHLLTSDNKNLLEEIIIEKKIKIEKNSINEDFLFKMLSSGYIDENYRYYITKSYIENFEHDEKEYINIVKEKEKPKYNLIIKDCNSVIKKIRDDEWSTPSVLNNDILTHLISNKIDTKLKWFLNAIKENKKNDFIDQYIESINNCDNKKENINYFLQILYNKLQSDIPNKLKLEFLLSFFSDNSESLFNDFLNKNFNSDYNFEKVLNTFFEKRQPILDYTLEQAEEAPSQKKKLSELNLEIEKLSSYKESTQKLLIDNAMFQISKDNLDYILTKQEEIPPHFYYDYIRSKRKLKEKVINSKNIEKFVDEILLTDDKIHISPEGIVDLLFSSLFEDDIAEQIIKKLDNEFIDLTYLPKFYNDNTTFILELDKSLIHILIEQNKIKVDFNNVLYISSSKFTEDIILFAQKQIDKQSQNISLDNIDTFAKNHFLSSFYSFLLTESKASIDLFVKESDYLTKQGIDILQLITSLNNEGKEILPDKMQMLIELAFKRPKLYNDSCKTFLTIIRDNFDYFYNNFNRIKSNCYTSTHLKNADDEEKDFASNHSWVINLSILLKNEFNILNQQQLFSIINIISLGDLSKIIKEWSYNTGIYNTSKLVDSLVDEGCIEAWLKKFDKNEILNFFNSIKEYLGYETEDKLLEFINKDNYSQINSIAKKYEITQDAITNYNDYDSYFKSLNTHIQYDFNFNWDKLDQFTQKTLNSIIIIPSRMLNSLFILGRYFYKAMENGKIHVDDIFSEKNKILMSYSNKYPLNPILCGLVFEAYFDQNGKLKKEEKKSFFDQLIKHFESFKNTKCHNFIRKCLEIFSNQIIYIPGDPDLIFKINGKIAYDTFKINSIKCFGIELLTKSPNSSNNRILSVEGKRYDLILSIRQYFNIPIHHIKIEPDFEKYVIKSDIDFIQPLNLIAPLINKNKDMEKDFN